MIKFIRDFFSGPIYVVVVIISIILIMAIIGRLMEKKQKQEEAEGKIAHVGRKIKNVEPISQINNNVNEIPSAEGAPVQQNSEENK